jgi:hypothetical protein
MQSWVVSYADIAAEPRRVESRTALDAAKDFALLQPRKDDCTVEVAPTEDAGATLLFERKAGIFSPKEPEPAVPAPTPPPPAPTITTPAGADTYSYRGWLLSDSFLKRCFAVTGYSMVGHAIVALLVWTLIFGTLVGCFSLVNVFSHR